MCGAQIRRQCANTLAQAQANAPAQARARCVQMRVPHIAPTHANTQVQASQAQAHASVAQASTQAPVHSQPEVHALQPEELRSTEVVLEESNTPKRKHADLVSDQLLLAQNSAAELK